VALTSLQRRLGDNLTVRRALVMGGVWALGVVIAVAVAFAAVDRVASGVTPRDVARLSQRAIDEELRSSPSGARTPTVTPSTSPSASTTGVPPITVKTTTPTTSNSVPPPTSPSTTGPTPATTTSTTTTSTTTEVAQQNTVTTSQGGTLYTRCSGPDRIVFVAAVPKSGYQRTIDDESTGSVRQSFENTKHRSNIEAECSNGAVHAQVEEESADA
jgi:cytoskeletal protein RodZ